MDKRFGKKITSLIVIMIMVMTMLPTTAFATGESVTTPEEVTDEVITDEEIPGDPETPAEPEEPVEDPTEDPEQVLTKPAKISGLKVSVYGYKSLMITWNESEGADEYQVFRSKTGKKNTFKRIKTLSADTTSYRNTGLTCGKTYHYKVRALNDKGSSGLSSAVSRKVRPATVEITNIKPISYTWWDFQLRSNLRLYWDKVSGATSYQIYRKKEGAGSSKWKLFRTVSSKYGYGTDDLGKKTIRLGGKGYSNYSEADTIWEYKVRAVRKAGGKTTYGFFSDVKKWIPDWTPKEIADEAAEYAMSLRFTLYTLSDPMDLDSEVIPMPDGTTYSVKASADEVPLSWDPHGGSTWSVLWPMTYSQYLTKADIMKDLKDVIDADLEFICEINSVYWLPAEEYDPETNTSYIVPNKGEYVGLQEWGFVYKVYSDGMMIWGTRGSDYGDNFDGFYGDYTDFEENRIHRPN